MKKKLKKLGFKKKWFDDKSAYWWVKPFKLGEFKAKFYYDGRFSLIEIQTLIHSHNDIYKKSNETIWAGSFKQLIKKVKQYNKTKKGGL